MQNTACAKANRWWAFRGRVFVDVRDEDDGDAFDEEEAGFVEGAEVDGVDKSSLEFTEIGLDRSK